MKNLVGLVIFLFCTSGLFAQEVSTRTFTTPFVVHSVTYNGSPDPSECWESVAWGIVIKDEKDRELFFDVPYKDLMELEKQIGDALVEVEVTYYEERDYESNLLGNVRKVTLNGEVLFQQ